MRSNIPTNESDELFTSRCNEHAPSLDLRSITRRPESTMTKVCIDAGWSGRHEWIILGESNLVQSDSASHRWTLKAYMGRGACDNECDSSYAISMNLHDVTYDGTRYGRSTFYATIPAHGDASDIRVPIVGWDPFKRGAICDRCDTGHPVTEYLPPTNHKLHEALRGHRLHISIGPTPPGKT